jgi:hypothetical protein
MIVWINGAFGSGKTTTAALVQGRIPGARIFDPEYVGYLLTTFVPAPTGDFQDMQALATFAGLSDAVFVDAAEPPEEVADAIVAACVRPSAA